MHPHIKSAVWAGGLLAISVHGTILFLNLDQSALAGLAVVPLLPLMFLTWATHGDPDLLANLYESLMVAFLVWWAGIDLCRSAWRLRRRPPQRR